MVDVAVVGLGPAGRALASRLVARGASVLAVDPRPEAVWSPTYGVWAEDGANDLHADNAHAEKLAEGTVDWFTRDDAMPAKPIIEAALTAAGCAWYLNSIQMEDDTGYIHLEWVFQGA